MKKKPKEYKIATVEDMFDLVTEENAQNFLIDFVGIVDSWLKIKAIAKKNNIKPSDVKSKNFIWIDDKKHEGKISFEKRPQQ